MAEEKVVESKPEEFRVHEANLDWLNKKFGKMQKIAVEVKSKPPAYKVVREEFEERIKHDLLTDTYKKTGVFDKILVITVEGEAPKLAGWSFVATLTPTTTGNLINKMPTVTEDLPVKYRTAAPYCDYCQKTRNRTVSYIVKGETGEYKQIGSNCLAKFLGYSNPEKVAIYATWLAGLKNTITEEEEDFAHRSNRHYDDYIDLEEFLAMVVAVIERDGWVSRATEQATQKPATVGEALYQLSPTFIKTRWNSKITPTAKNKARAREAIAFARSDKLKDDTDFKHNLKIAMASDMFHHKASAVVASIINFHDRVKEWEIQQKTKTEEAQKRNAEFKKSEFQGKAGDKIAASVKVIRRTPISGQYGTTYMFRMMDASNNIYIWFSSNDLLEVEKAYNIAGTVKNHETYNDIKQTILTRCKAQEIPVIIKETPHINIDIRSLALSQRVVKHEPIKREHSLTKKPEHTPTVSSLQ